MHGFYGTLILSPAAAHFRVLARLSGRIFEGRSDGRTHAAITSRACENHQDYRQKTSTKLFLSFWAKRSGVEESQFIVSGAPEIQRCFDFAQHDNAGRVMGMAHVRSSRACENHQDYRQKNVRRDQS